MSSLCWNLSDGNLFDNNGEIHRLSRAAPRVIKDLESFLLVSHIVSDGKSLRGKGKATLDDFSLFLSFFLCLSLFFWTLTSARSIRHASPHFLPGKQRRHVHHQGNYTHHQLYNAAELVFGLGVALLFSLWPVGSARFIVSGLQPFVHGGFYITGFSITSPEEDFFFLNYALIQTCSAYEMCIRFLGSVVSLLLVTSCVIKWRRHAEKTGGKEFIVMF